MHFYQQCLGGDLAFQSIGDTPQGNCFPSDMQQVVLFSKLQYGELLIIGTDLTDENDLPGGGTSSMVLWLADAGELLEIFKKLQKGGKITHPISPATERSITGSLIDRFGVQWVLRVKPGG